MRKHFLILMLMALLPLSGFAEAINLSTAEDVVITLNRTQLDYTGKKTAPVVTGLSVGEQNLTAKLTDVTVTYYKKTGVATYTAIEAAQVRNAGDYALTLKGDGEAETFTIDESAKVDFTINPGELSITLHDATKVYGDDDPTVIEYDWDDMTQLRGDDDVNNVIINLVFSTTSRAAGESVNTTTGYAYNTITATTDNYNVTVNGSPVLFITKRPLTGTYTGTVAKVYGDADPAFDKTKLTFAGWAASEDTDAKKAAAITIADDATLSYEGTDANYDAAGTNPLPEKALYPITITGVTSDNYQLVLPANLGMMIKQRPITDAAVTITAQSAETTYNAAKNLLPSSNYSVTFQGNAATFDVKYYETNERNTEAIAEDNVKNAAKYYYQIEGKGNFSGVYSGVTAQNANGLVWEIKTKDLWIYALDDTKTYNGTKWGADEVNFEYSGLEGDDAVTTEAGATIGTTQVPNSANVNEAGYVVTPTTDAVVIKNGEVVVTDNYNIQGLATGKLKITKKALTLKAGDQTLDLGYTAAQLTAALAIATNVTVTGNVAGEDVAYNEDENAGILDVIASALDAELAATNSWNYADAGQYPGAINITWDTENVPDVLKNYDITVNRGKFTVNGGTFTMIAKNVTIKYGDELPAFEYLTSDNVTIKEGATVTYTVYQGETVIANPTEVGTYTIKIDENTEDYLPANFTGINYAPGTLKIEAKPLTVVVADQTLSVGQGAAALLQGAKYATITGVKSGETVKFNIVAGTNFNTAAVTEEPIENAITIELTAHVDGDDNNNHYVLGAITKGKLTVIPAATIVLNRPLRAAYYADPTLDNAADVIAAAAAETYDAAGANAYNSGLEGAVAAGDVQTPAEYTLTQDDAIDNEKTYYTLEGGVYTAVENPVVNDIEDYYELTTAEVLYTDVTAAAYNSGLTGAVAAGDKKKMEVTFGDFEMFAEKWYAMVLPFETSVAEVSREFGYAVVDVLNTDNNKNAVSFKLYMQQIPANTPFIFKVNEAMNMNEVTFSKKEIVNPANAAALTQTDAFGNKFIGTYTAKNSDWLEGQDYLFSVAETKDTYGPAVNGATVAASSYLNPVCAYITYKNVQSSYSARPIIYIEEPDGQTTAISVVNNQLVEADANGWYTINGMKLDAAPTQKGIYINNGKKIVVK